MMTKQRKKLKVQKVKSRTFYIVLVLMLCCAFTLFVERHSVQASLFEKRGQAQSKNFAALSGFEPGAIVSYKILSENGAPIDARGIIDERGYLNIPMSKGLSDAGADLIYDLSIDETQRSLSLLLRYDAQTREVAVEGASGGPFADIEITAAGENIKTRSDWAGLFEETGLDISADESKTVPVQVAFYSRNIASDAQSYQSPALIKVQLGTGAGSGSTASIIANYVNPLQRMTEQLSAVVMQQTMIIGTFLDAKLQLETQRTHQKLKAEAVKDYHPSEQMCRIGSYVRSMANVEAKMAYDHLALNDALMERFTNKTNASSDMGGGGDFRSRVAQFKDTYCDPSDHNGNLYGLCAHPAGVGATNPERTNKDIDYTRTVHSPYTLDINFTDSQLTDDEEDVIALAKNLYWSDVLSQANELQLVTNSVPYIRARQLMTLTNLAQSSYTKQVAMKASAPPPAAGSQPGWIYMKTMMRELGLSDADIEQTIGENPSYYAQMDILTKKLYQNPNFYTNLYDKPANVDRIDAALEAIKLMQLRDHYDASLRREMLMSGLVEQELMTDAERIQGTLVNMKQN